MKVGFPLKIQEQVKQIRVKLADNLAVHFNGNIPGTAGEFPKAGWAFRASQVAGSCRLNRNSEWIAPMPHLTCKAAEVITGI